MRFIWTFHIWILQVLLGFWVEELEVFARDVDFAAQFLLGGYRQVAASSA
mgnify:CR=1 FL=1